MPFNNRNVFHFPSIQERFFLTFVTSVTARNGLASMKYHWDVLMLTPFITVEIIKL
jgi:hypothetical protein